MKKGYFLLFAAIILNSCITDVGNDNSAGEFLEAIVPLDDFNSEFDDYNSALPMNKTGVTFFTFSSKREKKDVFNLVSFPAEFIYKDRLGLQKYKFTNASLDYFQTFSPSVGLANKANGNFNVLGPKLLSFKYDLISYVDSEKDLLLFYADDSAGHFDIKYIRNSEKGVGDPVRFDLLNSPNNDAYPSFSYKGDKIYFCSDRGGDFDIYEVSIQRSQTEKITVENLTKPENFTIRKMDELSSGYEDKCPYIYDDTMVFVSNRPGGKGGYDIYYSKLKDGKWSAPANAGERINTKDDEYRPILPSLGNFNYNVMIFSSNRAGGKGGFDLYMTGLDKKYN